MCDISMESSNLHQQHNHHHHLQDHQLIAESSSNNPPSLPSPCFSVAENDHAWRTPTFFLNNNGNIHATCGEDTPTSLNNSLIQEVGFPWPNNHITINQSTPHQEHHHQHIADKIKEEQSPSTSSDHHDNPTFAKFSDMLSSSTSSPSEMLLLKNTLSPTFKNHMLSNNRNLHNQPSTFQPNIQQFQNTNKSISTTFSQIFPSVNISNMNNNNNNKNMSSPISSSSSTIDPQMANNAQNGFDLFATARFLSGETLNNHSSSGNNLLELFEGSPRFNVDHDLQQSNDLKLCNIPNNNLSSFNNNNGVPADSKNYIMEQQSTHQMPSKKPRFEPRASCPPFKVRKEKLGDRIAALQQLVAPFGKTDTASVLMEAIGYIKFLQNQVETLSVPYMKSSSHNKSSNTTQRVKDDEFCVSDESILTDDLRSRGLCLVPQSCMSYINLASDATINGGIWPSPNFNPAGF
ncbi:transcription factor bHLH110-like [Chenopodium quinoa]|nr:transcription factor bHLH110-like [Chenopodium quinoa]